MLPYTNTLFTCTKLHSNVSKWHIILLTEEPAITRQEGGIAASKVVCRLTSAQGPRSKFSSGGAKEECVKENFGGGGPGGGHACGFLFNFS